MERLKLVNHEKVIEENGSDTNPESFRGNLHELARIKFQFV